MNLVLKQHLVDVLHLSYDSYRGYITYLLVSVKCASFFFYNRLIRYRDREGALNFFSSRDVGLQRRKWGRGGKVVLCYEMSGPRGLGHIVTGILCLLDKTNVGLIPLATVSASNRLPCDMY